MWKKRLQEYKNSNVSETRQDRTKVTIGPGHVVVTWLYSTGAPPGTVVVSLKWLAVSNILPTCFVYINDDR